MTKTYASYSFSTTEIPNCLKRNLKGKKSAPPGIVSIIFRSKIDPTEALRTFRPIAMLTHT